MKSLAIVVGGGPAPGINAVIAAATIEGRNHGVRVLGIQEGFRTLVRGDVGQGCCPQRSHPHGLLFEQPSRDQGLGDPTTKLATFGRAGYRQQRGPWARSEPRDLGVDLGLAHGFVIDPGCGVVVSCHGHREASAASPDITTKGIAFVYRTLPAPITLARSQ